METRFFIPRPKFEKMAENIACQNIVEGQNCSTVRFNNRLFVISSAVGTGTGRGWSYLGAYEVTPVESYVGDLVPLKYQAHFAEVLEGNRKRSYAGMIITADGISVVCLGPEINFYPLEEGTQIELFQNVKQ